MKHFKGVVYSDVEPSHDFLWIKPLENNLNDFYLYDKGWEKIDNSSKAITAINKSLERIDEIRRRYTDYYTRWAYEFESLFISPLNYDFIELEEDE